MDVIPSTALITLTSLLFSALPFLFKGLRKHSMILNFIGGILLSAVLVLDVIPEMIEHGGVLTLFLMSVSFAVFLFAHSLTENRKDDTSIHTHAEVGCASSNWLALSLAVHCLACGMLLCGSHEISHELGVQIAASLILHKAVEAFALSSLLIEKTLNRRSVLASIAIYTLAFPVGVAVAELGMGGENLESFAILAASVGMGALFGCLVQDFYLPVLRNFRLAPARKRSP